jgi:hypothetical protein
LWPIGALLLAGAIAFLVLIQGKPDDFPVRWVGTRIDSAGRLHFIYEISNRTSKSLDVHLVLETRHERTGWWKASNNNLLENAQIRRLNAKATSEVDIIAPPEGTAIRGELQYRKDDGRIVRKLRAFGYQLGLPRRWVMPGPSAFGDGYPFGSISLPVVEKESGQATAPPVAAPAGRPSADVPAGTIKLLNVDLWRALDIYAALADTELQIDEQVRILPTRITIENDRDLTRAEAVGLFEQVLRDQAGIVLTRVGTEHIAVRYDESLKGNSAR